MSVATISRESSAAPPTGRAARLAARSGQFKGATAGLAPGYVQGNLAILPGPPQATPVSTLAAPWPRSPRRIPLRPAAAMTWW